MTHLQQVSLPLDAALVLAQFKQATQQLFRRKLPADAPVLGVVPTLTGLEVTESSWAAWEALLNECEG